MNLKHTELIEYRQRLAALQRKRGDANDEQWKLQKWLEGKAKEYGVFGLRHQINPDTGEIEVYAETIHYKWPQSIDHAEKAAVGQNLWEIEGVLDSTPV